MVYLYIGTIDALVYWYTPSGGPEGLKVGILVYSRSPGAKVGILAYMQIGPYMPTFNIYQADLVYIYILYTV